MRGRPSNKPVTGEVGGEDWQSREPFPCSSTPYKIPLMRNLVKRAIGGVEEAKWASLKPITEWATSPWGQERSDSRRVVPDLGGWDRGAQLFLIVHSIYVRYFRAPQGVRPGANSSHRSGWTDPRGFPDIHERPGVFHWVMAASMFTLLFTAFLPKLGVQFNWVTFSWIAGSVLTVSIVFHVIHASFWLDFWAIWPDKADIGDAWRRVQRFVGAPRRRRGGSRKYPLENKLYHGAIIATALSAIATGVFMMSRVRTIYFPRNPYLFSDMTWGLMYVLHGLAGIGLIALVMVHVYFALRPEKLDITKSMVFGTMKREFYVEHYDPKRWVVKLPQPVSSRTDREA